RNPNLAFTDRMQDLPEELDPGLKVGPPAAPLFPISQNLTTADSHVGSFTAACGVTCYDGEALPREMRGNAFSCDPAGNLVHRDVILKRGATFTARRSPEPREFLASSDDWFRPVNLQIGPDGALYICDMYRRTIEHPVYLPEEVRKRTDFESGRSSGRIYRVTGATRKGASQAWLARKPQALARELSNPNPWARNTAHRLLWEKREAPAVSAVRRAFLDPLSSAAGRARALRLLHGWGDLSERDLVRGLRDRDPGVREVSVALSEEKLSKDGSLARQLESLASDADSHVRFQTALSIGESSDRASVIRVLSTILRSPELDRWTRAAALSSAAGQELSILLEFIFAPPPGAHGLETITQLAGLARKAGAANDLKALAPLLAGSDSGTQIAVLNGWFQDEPKTYSELAYRSFGAEPGSANAEIAALETAALLRALDSAQPVEVRESAVRFLQFLRPSALARGLALLKPETPITLQRAVVRSILGSSQPSVLFEVFDTSAWLRLSPGIREQIVGGFASRPELANRFLGLVRDDILPASAVSPAQRRQLQNSRNAEVKQLAVALFRSGETDREKVYEEYKSVLGLNGNGRKGEAVFQKSCAACHRLDRIGTPVGPDLFSIRNLSKEAILMHIILPDLEIAAGFNLYALELKDGTVVSGIIRSETESALTVRMADGQDRTVPRSAVESLQAGTVSMMPRELEKTMSRQELADLLAFLKGQ
ncbi:MAG TPA: c-type cytochrome, partial [Verrucomicrobiae bacterium]|nr:c-type cytochrome [Verrucomicrobiae bacterium]